MTRSSVDIIDRAILTIAAAIAAICLYLNWIVVYSGSIRYESLTMLQLSGDAGAGLMHVGLESLAVVIRVVIVATTVFWAFFIWRIIVFSAEHIRFFAYLAGVLTVLLAICVSIFVSTFNSSYFVVNDLHPGISEINLSPAPFIAAAFSITIMLIVSLKYQRHRKNQFVRTSAYDGFLEEDIEVRISTDADYRLMYHGPHSVGFIADMGDAKTANISPSVTASIMRGISGESKVCPACGELIRYRISSCNNCGNTISKE